MKANDLIETFACETISPVNREVPEALSEPDTNSEDVTLECEPKKAFEATETDPAITAHD
jgi:hypothetical protein